MNGEHTSMITHVYMYGGIKCLTYADLAKHILDQCVVEGDLRDNPHDLEYSVAFNYEFIDDVQDYDKQ